MYYNDSLQLTNNYNIKGELTSVTDSISNENVTYGYNSLGQLTSYTEKQNSATKVKQTFTYDEYGNISQEKITGQASQTYKYSYDNLSDRRFNGMSFDGIKVDIKYYENLDRIKTKKVTYNGTEIYTKTYYYRKVKHDSLNYATNQPESIIYTQGEATKQNIQYTYYDATGLLSDISYNGDSIHYSYDGGKLSRENNQLLGMSRMKYYHDNGNISMDIKGNYTGGTAAISNSSSTSYSYSGDRMMSFGNQACEYDSMGNPTKYRGKSATWKGRQLLSYAGVDFTYDGRGRRITKDSVTYVYDSQDRLIKQTSYSQYSTQVLEFYYDFEGVAAVSYNGFMFFYVKDGQGNIISLVDKDGNEVVHYNYDAWGNHEVAAPDGGTIAGSTHIGNLNPFRYRSYYYDTETGLYFLQTRYYDPEVGRFLNRDSVQYAAPEAINGLNLYAYCLNNPVEYVDPNGSDWQYFLTTIERALIGIADFGNFLVRYPDKFTISWKQFHKYNPKISFRQFGRDNVIARQKTIKLGQVLNKIGFALSVATLLFDIGDSWAQNYNSGKLSWISDSVVDTIYLSTRFAIGAGITTLVSSLIPIPFLGTLVGIGVSMLVDVFIQFMFEATDTLNQIKSWAADVGQSIVNGWNYFWSFAWI